ncbi:MAG: phosphotransferase family protein [Gammaproteobacteria bacterium]|nr:phosphotransferase family protein [Gammaproteobacteria bacterium]
MVTDELRRSLEAFIQAEIGADLALDEVHDSDGHAGLTFLFSTRDSATKTRHGEYVLKIPPKGVARHGNTDVYRQAPLLRALHAADLPVPRVPWAGAQEQWFGVPFIVMERLPGRTYFVWDPHSSFERSPAAAGPLWRQAVEVLPRFHQFDWRRELKNWQAPEPLIDQISRWRKIYLHAPEPRWIEQAEGVEALLLKTMPDDAPIGLYHGDYQPGNILYADGRLTGVIDWEISGIGDCLLDIGWLMMVADPANWVEAWHSIYPPTPEEIRDIYEQRMGQRYAAIPWYQAFAGYRLASIGCLNVKLHRKGQRHDPIWENMGLCLSKMFERAREILAGGRA